MSTRRSGRHHWRSSFLGSLLIALPITSDRATAAPCWDPPLVAPVSDPYREPPCRWCPGNRGIEFDTRPGDVVRAVASGRVTFAGDVAGRRYLVIEHGDGRRATYGLLATVRYRTGEIVIKGSIIGTVGERFHFGVRDGDSYLDPTPYLGRRVYRVRLVPPDGAAGRVTPSTLVCRSVSQA